MKKAYVYVVLTALLFGTMEVACKVAGNQLDPFQFTFIRFAIGGLILLPFAVQEMKKDRVKLNFRDIIALSCVGALGIPLSMVFPVGSHQFQCRYSFSADKHKSAVYDGICPFLRQ